MIDYDDVIALRGYLNTGIRDLDAAKRYLKQKFNQGQPEPVATRPGARFYVSARRSTDWRPLLGPYASHMMALAAVPHAKRMVRERFPMTLASIGTCSTPDTRPTVFGR